jgi:hypothetical protein
MPFGLCNAPATFQSLMNDLLRPFIGTSCLCYLDDILVYSKTVAEHDKHLRDVLTVFRQNQLYANPSKCALYQKQGSFLGHVISPDGVGMEVDKVAAIRTWPTPKNSLSCVVSWVLHHSTEGIASHLVKLRFRSQTC